VRDRDGWHDGDLTVMDGQRGAMAKDGAMANRRQWMTSNGVSMTATLVRLALGATNANAASTHEM